jgi:hypothetical protein
VRAHDAHRATSPLAKTPRFQPGIRDPARILITNAHHPPDRWRHHARATTHPPPTYPIPGCHAHTRRPVPPPPSDGIGEGGHATCANARQTLPNHANARHHLQHCKTNPVAKMAVPPPLLRVPFVSFAPSRSCSPPRPRNRAQHRATKPHISLRPRKTNPPRRPHLGVPGALAVIPPPLPRGCVKFPNEPISSANLAHPPRIPLHPPTPQGTLGLIPFSQEPPCPPSPTC